MFRWKVELISKNKMVAAVSAAEVPFGIRWEKFAYLGSMIEQTMTEECEN